MIEWIWGNREWIFSGIGIAIITVIFSLIINRKKSGSSHNNPASSSHESVTKVGDNAELTDSVIARDIILRDSTLIIERQPKFESIEKELRDLKQAIIEQTDINKKLVLLLENSQKTKEIALYIENNQGIVADQLSGLKDATKKYITKEAISVGQTRVHMLISRIDALERTAELINHNRMFLLNQTNSIWNQIPTMSEGPDQNLSLVRIKRIQEADKVLELQLRRIDTQRTVVEKELNAVKRVIQLNT